MGMPTSQSMRPRPISSSCFNMTLMRNYFVKPQIAITMTFSEDPMMGMTTDRFTGSATAKLITQSFVVRTASLR